MPMLRADVLYGVVVLIDKPFYSKVPRNTPCNVPVYICWEVSNKLNIQHTDG